MQIDVNLRAQAARLLLDAVSVMNIDDAGSADADGRALLALDGMNLDLESNPSLAAAVAASTDLLWYLTVVLAQWNKISREELISKLRSDVLPQTYADADAYRDVQ